MVGIAKIGTSVIVAGAGFHFIFSVVLGLKNLYSKSCPPPPAISVRNYMNLLVKCLRPFGKKSLDDLIKTLAVTWELNILTNKQKNAVAKRSM